MAYRVVAAAASSRLASASRAAAPAARAMSTSAGEEKRVWADSFKRFSQSESRRRKLNDFGIALGAATQQARSRLTRGASGGCGPGAAASAVSA
jgi:hypothetical protein